MAKIVVTGGAGFLGSALCRQLLADGYDVLCVDDFSTGFEVNIAELLQYPSFSCMQHDVCEPLYVDVDGIFHLASPASPSKYHSDPIRTIKTNFLGTLNMLGLAKRCGVPMLQASTSEVYGNPEQHPQRESYWGSVNPIGIRSCYDEGKRCAETLCFDYKRKHGVDVKVVRIFNTYGPRMDVHDGRVVSNFIVQALHNDPITVYGSGEQTRSFCYVDDLIEGLLAAYKTPLETPVNLGNPVEHTILSLVETIIARTGSTSSITFGPLPEDDPCKRKPDITLARSALGWTPKVSLNEGLNKTIAYFQSIESAASM